MLEYAALLIILAARIPFFDLLFPIAVMLQICAHFGLWMFISLGIFWLHDVLGSIRLNRNGKVQLEAGVCGCRVGLSGERIQFGAAGCRCVGGNKNRGLIDYSAENAFNSALSFAREIIKESPGEIWSLVRNVWSGVRNIVRVSLGFSIASLAHLALKLIEMCSLLSSLLHELDTCPVLSCIVLGLMAKYFG